ncbi:oxidoreductase family NAD-binding rossmann fold domain-containing protein [Penicillium sp. IBT 16267x]|nr:oxidoreductase family NAD-binding rossmann fold domain-containing protein [Penicillium sp. IBT 16267x]
MSESQPIWTLRWPIRTTQYTSMHRSHLRGKNAVKKAVAAGKHIYCEKPTAVTTAEALELSQIAEQAGVKNGVVQDKLWLPSLVKLKGPVDSGFFGEILSVRGEFGYWVFDGENVVCQMIDSGVFSSGRSISTTSLYAAPQ